MTLSTPYEIIEISSPYGKTIVCAKRGNVLIPISKITKFGLGRVQFSAQVERLQLRQERQLNQRQFAKNQEKVKRLERLERLAYNYQRSQGNLKAIQDVGLDDSDNVVTKLIDHLLIVGESVATASYQMSQIEAPSGKLSIQSYWQVLNDGRNYLATVIFKSTI